MRIYFHDFHLDVALLPVEGTSDARGDRGGEYPARGDQAVRELGLGPSRAIRKKAFPEF